MAGRLYDRIRRAAVAGGPGSAVTSPAAELGHRQLLAAADRLAVALGDDPGPVLLYGHKEPALVAALVAALRLVRPYVPADVSVPAGRLVQVLDLVRPTAVVAAQPLPAPAAAALARLGARAVTTDAGGGVVTVTAGTPPGDRRLVAGEVAYVMCTSGTTATPKGVVVPYRGLDHFLGWLLAEQGFAAATEVFLNQAPFHFDLSVMDVYSALLTGGTLFCLDRSEVAEPRRLYARLAGAPVSVFVSTPSFARFCLAEPRFAAGLLPRLGRFLFCGETLPPAVARELLTRFPAAAVWNTYGPTETTVAVTSVRVTADRLASDEPLPVGRPAPGLEVWVAPADQPAAALPVGATGEMVAAGPQVALGYLGADHAASGFLTLDDGRRAYRTGDVGHRDADGLLYCDGRRDRQVKLHGYRLELEEVEAHLRRLVGVADAAVLAVRRGGRADHLVAFLVPGPGAALPADDLELGGAVRRALAAQLPAWALPRRVVLLAALPLTAAGKLDQAALEGLAR